MSTSEHKAAPGYKTTEFWLTALGNVIVILQGLQGTIDAQWVVIALAVINGIYTTMRSLVKSTEK